jgi:hypothetical protein
MNTNGNKGNKEGWKRSHRKFDEQVERVILALPADDGGRERPPQSRL